MQVDYLDYLGLAELAASSLSRKPTADQSVDGATADGGDMSSSGTYNNDGESGQLTLDQQRSLKDAQDGLMSLQAMGDAMLLGGRASQTQSNINNINSGGGSLSPQSLLGLGEYFCGN